MDEILRMVKGFQVADKNGVAIPADWPNNEIIGDHVIIPLQQTSRLQQRERARKVATTGSATRAFDTAIMKKFNG